MAQKMVPVAKVSGTFNFIISINVQFFIYLWKIVFNSFKIKKNKIKIV